MLSRTCINLFFLMRTKYILINDGNHTVICFFYYGSQWLPSKMCLPSFIKMSFFNRVKKQVQHNIRVSYRIFTFGRTMPLILNNGQSLFSILISLLLNSVKLHYIISYGYEMYSTIENMLTKNRKKMSFSNQILLYSA